MSYSLVNETLAVVDQEIDKFLMEFPGNHPFAMALSLDHFRQQLKAKVLSKIPNRHRIKADKTKESFSVNRFMGGPNERLAIEEKIRRVMPEIINSGKNYYSRNYLTASIGQGNEKKIPNPGSDWWLKIHTIIPCVTYYFGPFANKLEARESYSGYFEDLREEKAIGIFGTIQQGHPQNLTVVDCPEEMKQDQQKLWNNYKKVYRLYRQKLALEASSHWLPNVLPGNHLLVDCEGKIQDANQNACRLFNLDLESLRGDNFVYYVPQQQISLFKDHLENIVGDRGEWQVPYRWSMQIQSSSIAPIDVDIQVTQKRDKNGQVTGFYWLLNDITSLQTINNQLYYDSRHDILTLLPNRRSLSHFLENLPHNHRPEQYHEDNLFALLVLDVNKFKQINDQFGHSFGDKVLQKVAENLLQCVREGDQVSRLSGDEFVIVLKSIQSVEEAKKCAYRIHRIFSLPLVLEDKQLAVGVSIGIVISNSKQFDHDRLVEYADTAMYEAKRKGMLFVVFDDSQPSANGKSHPVPVEILSSGHGDLGLD